VLLQFRTDPWADADEIVLVFSEKRGMTPIIYEITECYGAPLLIRAMRTRSDRLSACILVMTLAR
jgi:hypothetical protein